MSTVQPLPGTAAPAPPQRRGGLQPWMAAFAAGALFGLGLVLSGMTQPAKVQGFLDGARIAHGDWDASLALVMAGAVAVALAAFALTPPSAARPARRPWLAERFALPTRRDIDGPLIVGAALFGAGWGLAGYCPGPALAALWSGRWDTPLFVLAMLAGMGLARRWMRWRHGPGS